MKKPTCAFCLLALSSALLMGCGGGPRTVRGVVTMDGAPVAGATVLFMPDGPGHPASGFTSSDGAFRLTTYKEDDGALPGKYRVLIQKTEAAKDPGTAERSALERAKAKIEEKTVQKRRPHALPDIYAKFDTTPLRCNVPTSGTVTFNLDKDGK